MGDVTIDGFIKKGSIITALGIQWTLCDHLLPGYTYMNCRPLKDENGYSKYVTYGLIRGWITKIEQPISRDIPWL